MKRILLATKNMNKLREFKQILFKYDYEVISLSDLNDNDEVTSEGKCGLLFSDTEKKLYEYDFNLVENDYTYYMKNHDKFVIEYNARIESYINAMKNSDYDLSDSIYDNINFYYDNESLLKIYKDKNYLLILKNIIKECNYEDSKKILLGLPIEENTKIKIKEYDPNTLYYVSKNI